MRPFSVETKKENTTRTIIKHLLFDNFPCLTYPDQVSQINNLIFMLKHSILVLRLDGWMFTLENKEENIDQKSGKNCYPYPLFLNIDCPSFLTRDSSNTYIDYYWFFSLEI